MSKLGFTFVLVLLCGPAPVVRGGGTDVSPKALLSDALKLARELPAKRGYADWQKPLLLLRIGETMRLHGLKDDAAGALEACRAANARSEFEAVRAEIVIELCGDLTLLGRTAEARALAKDMKYRSYGTAALYVIARTALEMGNTAEAEAAIRDAPALTRSPKAKAERSEDLWTRALAGLAVRMNKLELARSLIEPMGNEPWKSGALGDVATALARGGQSTEALEVSREIPDPYMAVLAFSRVAAVFSERASAEQVCAAVDALSAAAAKIENEGGRDFALRMAVGRLAAAGNMKDAARLAADVKDPCLRFLAQCELLTNETFEEMTKAVALCPGDDRDLLWEALAISAGRKGMVDGVMKASNAIGPPWHRLRARCAAARELVKTGAGGEAERVLDAAAESVSRIETPGWRCCAHIRLAIEYDLARAAAAADKQFDWAKGELLQVKEADVKEALLARLVEAMVAIGRKEAAKKIITEALEADPSSSLRDQLVPLLAAAGEVDGALAENARARLKSTVARRVFVYRLAQGGKTEGAIEQSRTFDAMQRAEALTDIARTQVRAATPKSHSQKAVGVCLHGSWGSWFPRLERMGVRWELMPFFEPYEVGAEGLKAKYIALGYPGTGGHFDHLSMVGVEQVREYLYSGGGFMGICAGQFLATKGNFVTCGAHGIRGQGPHQVQMRKNHLVSLRLPPVIIISRRNGGMLMPGPGCEVLGWYDKVDRYAALIAEPYGLGRVVAFSPHPEGSRDFIPRDVLCINALNWVITGLP